MSDRTDRPARQEADMLESLLAERRRTAGKPKDRTSDKKKRERSDSKPETGKTPDKPSQ
jgi:hypothetical protein